MLCKTSLQGSELCTSKVIQDKSGSFPANQKLKTDSGAPIRKAYRDTTTITSTSRALRDIVRTLRPSVDVGADPIQLRSNEETT